jgi:hypothetical protein
MKNIHLIPTDKPSRLYKTGNFLLLDSKAMPNNILETINQHIYITNDLEIKEGDWIIWNKKIVKAIDTAYYSAKKIILTTDQDLIKYGVQAIDDTFLEWLVKNPSCEKVEVVDDTYTVGEMSKLPLGTINHKYKIVIPQEEPKQETIEEAANNWIKNTSEFLSVKNGFIEGAKWQSERMYSEEEVIEILHSRVRYTLGEDYKEVTTIEWFEQFKKK